MMLSRRCHAGHAAPKKQLCSYPRNMFGFNRVRVARIQAVASPPQAEVLRPTQSASLAAVEATAAFLKQELRTIFSTGEITPARYSPNIVFEDPITRVTDINTYTLMIRALKTLFNITFDLHDVAVTSPYEITTRWTMSLQVWELPWQPTLLFSGRSFYKVDSRGTILSHRDVWDSVDNNSFLSTEALAVVLKQLLELQLTPNIESPKYTLLRVAKDFEIRYYKPMIVAETAMPQGSTPAGGAGFNELAGYIFGGNSDSEKMEMTTPVFTRSPTVAGSSSSSGRAGDGAVISSEITMQFPMEAKFADVDDLPQPKNKKVRRKQLPGTYSAALRFSGLPFDWEVKSAEQKLRSQLLKDGLRPKAGYSLARYNEPWVPLPLRRNEVLIELADFEWP